jgi:hypothetical protein
MSAAAITVYKDVGNKDNIKIKTHFVSYLHNYTAYIQVFIFPSSLE